MCTEGSLICSGGSQACSDTSGDDLEVCDGDDNDCNPATVDGSDEAWLGDACDGADSDLCLEGSLICSGGSQACSDTSGDNQEICNGADDDCDVQVDEGFDADADGIADCFDACPNDPDNDVDTDGVCGDVDNCPAVSNASQANVDVDGFGDLCDVCPSDPSDGCNPAGSTADEIEADEGGTVVTPDEAVAIKVEPGDLGGDTTISVTQTVPNDSNVDLMVGTNPGLGTAVAVYDLEAEGPAFIHSVTITVTADVTNLNQNQREHLTLYQWDDIENAFVAVEGTVCDEVVEDPLGTFTKTCTAELSHFSLYSMVAPLDTDGDGICDQFGEEVDHCPESDLSATIAVNSCDTGVENQLLNNGCTISDRIAECAAGARNHGQFVSCVSDRTNELKHDGYITGKDKGAIQRCAAKADIPPRQSSSDHKSSSSSPASEGDTSGSNGSGNCFIGAVSTGLGW